MLILIPCLVINSIVNHMPGEPTRITKTIFTHLPFLIPTQNTLSFPLFLYILGVFQSFLPINAPISSLHFLVALVLLVVVVSKMLRKGSKRVTFSPDIYEKPMISFKYNSDVGSMTPRSERLIGRSFGSRGNGASSPMRFLCRVGNNVVNAFRRFSRTRRKASARDCTLEVAPRRYSAAGDHYRSEAIDDCIEFINSYRKSF